MNDLASSSLLAAGGVPFGSAPPSSGASASPSTNNHHPHSAHLTMLRDELRDSVLEEERLLDRMAELAQARSVLKVQVQQREAEAEVVGIRRRKEKLQAARHALRL